MPAQDLNNQGRKLQNGVRVLFLNVICLLNVLYMLVKYHENILTCFKGELNLKKYCPLK